MLFKFQILAEQGLDDPWSIPNQSLTAKSWREFGANGTVPQSPQKDVQARLQFVCPAQTRQKSSLRSGCSLTFPKPEQRFMWIMLIWENVSTERIIWPGSFGDIKNSFLGDQEVAKYRLY